MPSQLRLDKAPRLANPAELLGRPLNTVEAHYAPKALFVQGDPEVLSNAVGVSMVGTRNPSEFGRRRARKLARLLAEKGFVVISGLARGIDTEAHGAAIAAGGRTVAVLGTPLDRVYPAENSGLQECIGSDHLLVSQFPLGTPTRQANFPQRNRTMALLSNATVIIEAGEKSGTRSQGWEALRLGRPLFLLKSLVDNPALDWPGQMVAYGAFVLENPEDILEVLPDPDPHLAEAIAF